MRPKSTPFYLYDVDARRRIAENLRDIELVAIQVDRGYLNWMHLWVDGLRARCGYFTAGRSEDTRVEAR